MLTRCGKQGGGVLTQHRIFFPSDFLNFCFIELHLREVWDICWCGAILRGSCFLRRSEVFTNFPQGMCTLKLFFNALLKSIIFTGKPSKGIAKSYKMVVVEKHNSQFCFCSDIAGEAGIKEGLEMRNWCLELCGECLQNQGSVVFFGGVCFFILRKVFTNQGSRQNSGRAELVEIWHWDQSSQRVLIGWNTATVLRKVVLARWRM